MSWVRASRIPSQTNNLGTNLIAHYMDHKTREKYIEKTSAQILLYMYKCCFKNRTVQGKKKTKVKTLSARLE